MSINAIAKTTFTLKTLCSTQTIISTRYLYSGDGSVLQVFAKETAPVEEAVSCEQAEVTEEQPFENEAILNEESEQEDDRFHYVVTKLGFIYSQTPVHCKRRLIQEYQ